MKTPPRFSLFVAAGLAMLAGGTGCSSRPPADASSSAAAPGGSAAASSGTSGPVASGEPSAAPAQAAAESQEDLYKVPATDDIEALFAYIDKVQGFIPNNEAEYKLHKQKASAAVEAAARKILALEKDPKSAGAQQAAEKLLEARLDNIDQATPEQQREILQDYEKTLAGRPLTEGDAQTATAAATTLEYQGDRAVAAQAYTDFARIFAASGEPGLEKRTRRFEGAARRLSLVGKPLEIQLNRLNGQPFDWAKYRGKIVLVDFWATWCRPCLAELPNVKRAYEKYHNQGFEVVGISIDDDLDALNQFLAKEEIPWTTLNEPRDSGGETPVSDYYGIMGVPTVFLVGRDGNVISLDARGEKLSAQLAKIFGN